MFELSDIPRLLLSALIILPIVTIIRETGYYTVVTLLGATNKKLTIGSGPVLFRTKTIEARRYFFMYSWFEYDELQPDSRFWHGLIYASPILSNVIVAIILNSLLAEGILERNMFWDIFLFYVFYFVLFDVIPVYLPDGQPTNGRAIFDLVWHGERSDYIKKEVQEQIREIERELKDADTQEQKETMQNRDRDQLEKSDLDSHEGYTESQKATIENRDRDQYERDDHSSIEKQRAHRERDDHNNP
ncbi:hypothetical protein HNR44_003553 [Geomicrobium halophilum]|uniref:Uncharacterized protein n=1 Tax=Geomicrobium halophilum TaxID=549000 RepID=A0A841PRW6_9BACL|nr:hypothetical protein [Geomicrobium halophilum]MBB6451540.1 hypothetical protein [Geomicrobium halophilum]